MRNAIAAVLLAGALLAGLLLSGAIRAGSAEGRQLTGAFCTNPNALPKPGACIELSFGDQTAQGYTGSTQRVISLRPGDYWLTVDDTSAAHNFVLESPEGADRQLTAVADAPGEVTVQVHLTHGLWTLYCDPHRMMGMFVTADVGGVGQTDE
jgi:hypothetical protein